MSALAAPFHRAIAAAAGLTGQRFGLLVASSVVATSAIVASAITSPAGPIGPLAALLGRSMASENTPVAGSPTPGPSQPSAGHTGPRSPGGGSNASTGGPPASPVPSPAPEAGGPESKEAAPPTEPLAEASKVKHVFVVSLTSPGYEASFGETGSQMPYLSTTLRPQGELLTKYSLLDPGPVPNDIAAVSGQKPSSKTRAGCPQFDECVLPVEIPTIADQLSIGRFTWKAYMGEMADPTGKPAGCVYPGAEEPYPAAEGGYTATRNPFVFFHSLLDLGDCATDDVPLETLTEDLRKPDSTAAYSFIAPTLCESGATVECPAGKVGGPAAADAFLARWVPKILSSAAYRADGMLIVTFDQVDPVPAAEGSPASAVPPPPLQVGTLLLSRFLAPGSTDAKPYDPYSLLRSTEDAFGLEHLGAADAIKTKSFTTAVLGEEGGGD
jgi:hypothetical protein